MLRDATFRLRRSLDGALCCQPVKVVHLEDTERLDSMDLLALRRLMVGHGDLRPPEEQVRPHGERR